MLQQVNRQFSIEWIGNMLKQNLSKDFEYEGEYHDFIEMALLVKGKIEETENENIYTLQPGDMIFHAPMEFHTMKSISNTPLTIYRVSCVIKGRVPSNLFEGVFSLNAEEKSFFMKFVDRAYHSLGKEVPSAFETQLFADELSTFILKLCLNNNVSNKFSDSSSAKLFKTLVNEMTEHLYDNISLASLSEKLNISVSYLKTLFYKHLGISPKKYYSQLRLIESTKLLDNGFSPAEIAEKMNFSSVSHFSVFFKENMGITPSKYKKESQEKERTKLL